MRPEGGSKGADLRGLVYIAIGVLFFSTSPILVRWAAPLSPSEITFGRMATAALALGLVVALRGGISASGAPISPDSPSSGW